MLYRKMILSEEDDDMMKSIRVMMTAMLALTLYAVILTGCGKKPEPVAELPEE